MNAYRARVYARVIRALDGPHALRASAEQRARLREAADTLLFALAPDGETRLALHVADGILLSIQGELHDPWIEQLADDLEATGPPQHRIRRRPA